MCRGGMEDIEYGADSQKEKKTTEKIHERNKGGHGEGSVTGKDTRDRVRWR